MSSQYPDTTTDHPPWRPADPAEIRRFYRDEFQNYISEIPDWVAPPQPVEYAAALNDDYPRANLDIKGSDTDFIRWSTIHGETDEHTIPYMG
jgi:hypothetical protein